MSLNECITSQLICAEDGVAFLLDASVTSLVLHCF